MLSTRERRIGIVAGLVLGALALDQLVVTPLLARKELADTRLATVQRDLETATRTIDNGQRARARWTEMAGDTLPIAASDAESQILNSVRDWAQASGLSLTSLKPDRSEQEQGFGKLTVRATANGQMRQVSQFLQQVQSADVPVKVSDLTLATRREGTDDLTLQIGLNTIYLPPAETGQNGEVTR